MLMLLAVALLANNAIADDRVKVSTYYETLCPDSMAFVVNQLYPTWTEIGQIMDVDLIPYGKAAYTNHSDGTVTFRCQHGARECAGNMIQACAVNLLQDTAKVLPLVYCMESQRAPDRAGQQCAERLNITWSPIQECASGTQGQQFLAAMGDRTHGLNPRLTFVPWININDVHTDNYQDNALYNLKKIVCETYTGNDSPPACASYVTTTTETEQGQTISDAL
jgi:interferon gamma-inducible protein 30